MFAYDYRPAMIDALTVESLNRIAARGLANCKRRKAALNSTAADVRLRESPASRGSLRRRRRHALAGDYRSVVVPTPRRCGPPRHERSFDRVSTPVADMLPQCPTGPGRIIALLMKGCCRRFECFDPSSRRTSLCACRNYSRDGDRIRVITVSKRASGVLCVRQPCLS